MLKTICVALLSLPVVAFAQEPGKPPAPPPAAPAATADEGSAGGIDDLRKEYDKIRESLFTSRARAAAVGATMYTAKVQVFLHYGTPRFFHLSRAVVRMDGANVFEDSAGAVGTDDAVRFEGFVAPGKHQITVHLDAEAKDDSSFVSSVEDSFTIDVPAKKLVTVRATADDNGDMGFAWLKKSRGSYKLHLDVAAESRELPKGVEK